VNQLKAESKKQRRDHLRRVELTSRLAHLSPPGSPTPKRVAFMAGISWPLREKKHPRLLGEENNCFYFFAARQKPKFCA
jgi:hypothetical protein